MFLALDDFSFALTLFFLFLAIVGGFALGKLLYGIIVVFVRNLAKKTKTSLDDFVLEYVEGPLEVATIVLSVFVLSNFLPALAQVHDALVAYSLAILVLLGSYLAAEVVGAVLKWYHFEGAATSRVKVDVTILPFLRKVSRVLILFGGLVWSLSIVGIDVSGILTVTSVLMLVLGLASQETLANIFAGMAIQLDRPYVYGDYLKFTTGEVARLFKIGLRSAKLEDLNGNLMIISNSELAKQRLVNLSQPTDKFKFILQIELPSRVDFDKFKAFISKQIEASNVDGLKKSEYGVLLEKISKDNFTVAVSFWVSDFTKLAEAKSFVNEKALEFCKK